MFDSPYCVFDLLCVSFASFIWGIECVSGLGLFYLFDLFYPGVLTCLCSFMWPVFSALLTMAVCLTYFICMADLFYVWPGVFFFALY